jgi:hypothetical protein
MRVMNGVEGAAVDRDLFQCLMFNARPAFGKSPAGRRATFKL